MSRKRNIERVETLSEVKESNSAAPINPLTFKEIVSIIKSKNAAKLRQMFEKGLITDVNMRQEAWPRLTLLLAACIEDSVDCVNVFYDYKADINILDDMENNALMCACHSGSVEMVKFILTHSNISLSELNWMHEDVTCIAVKFGHLEVLKYILKGTDRESVCQDNLNQALGYACVYDRLDFVMYLVEIGADINDTIDMHSRSTPLKVAIGHSSVNIIEYLLDHGADMSGNKGIKLIKYACSRNRPATVELLLKRGIDPNATEEVEEVGGEGEEEEEEEERLQYRDNSSILAYARHNNRITHILIEYGADPCTEYAGGSTVLLDTVKLACTKKPAMDTVILLLHRGANVNTVHNHTGESPLMIAATTPHVELVRLLLVHGADVTHKNRAGTCVLDTLGRTRTGKEVAEICKQYIDTNIPRDKAILK